MTPHLFVALVEVAPLSPNALGGGVVGGFVRCYAMGPNKRSVEKRFAAALLEAGVRVVNVEWCVRESEVDWEDPDNEEGRALGSEARTSGDVILGEFHVWGDEDSGEGDGEVEGPGEDDSSASS